MTSISWPPVQQKFLRLPKTFFMLEWEFMWVFSLFPLTPLPKECVRSKYTTLLLTVLGETHSCFISDSALALGHFCLCALRIVCYVIETRVSCGLDLALGGRFLQVAPPKAIDVSGSNIVVLAFWWKFLDMVLLTTILQTTFTRIFRKLEYPEVTCTESTLAKAGDLNQEPSCFLFFFLVCKSDKMLKKQNTIPRLHKVIRPCWSVLIITQFSVFTSSSH